MLAIIITISQKACYKPLPAGPTAQDSLQLHQDFLHLGINAFLPFPVYLLLNLYLDRGVCASTFIKFNRFPIFFFLLYTFLLPFLPFSLPISNFMWEIISS